MKIKVVFPEINITRITDRIDYPNKQPNSESFGHDSGKVFGQDSGNNLTLHDSVLNFLLSRLNSLILDSYLPAGFSWFYENWHRDELLSMFLMQPLWKNFSEQRIKFYLYNLENIWDKNKPDGSLAADTFLLFLLNLPQDLFGAHFNLLENYLQKWQKEFDLDNLPPYSTWMDTLERKNALEIDVLYLKALRRFAKINKDYVPLANNLKGRIIKKIKENPVDVNLIFAFLFLEDIFTLNEWKNFFEKLLKENYLSWGGLATLPLNNPKFLDEDDGEKVNAYHQGDSWYFLNNLLAYSLSKIDFKKFKNFIQKIIGSSFLDLFFDGALGWSSEISSAKERKSEGSLVQTWSIASLTFLLSFLQNLNVSLKPFGNSHHIITIES
jgi:glycogen debranching enzyme